MPRLSFEADTHDELVQQVRRWLASVDERGSSDEYAALVTQSAQLTKDALTVVARSAPGGIGQSELVQALTSMGYRATDATRDAALASLDALEAATGGSVVRNVADKGRQAVFEMNAQVAKQVLRAIAR